MRQYKIIIIVTVFVFLAVGLSQYVEAVLPITATGGTISSVNSSEIHKFTSSGFFCVTAGSGNVRVLVVAGGGGGGNGGGGAGGLRYNSSYPVSVGCYTVTVGAGGSGANFAVDSNGATSGGNSMFGNLTSTGGGAGRYSLAGVAGGSGGGGGGANAGGAASPAGQGNAGGAGNTNAGGGGGGSSAAGAAAVANGGGNGGYGTMYNFNGTSYVYSCGGGGGGPTTQGAAGCQVATAGTNAAQPGDAAANRGGGGGGSYNTATRAGNGGSGVVIVFIPPIGLPGPVTTLHSTDITTTTVSLAWSTPSLNGGTCSGYRINYTTPWGTPLTIISNNTGVCTTSYVVSGLVLNTNYTFRVGVWTQGGTTATGANKLNVTTDAFNQANYTIGSFSFNANNPLKFPIRYERIDGATTRVNVTFTNTFNLACDLRYTYAMTNHTYHTIPSIPISSTEREASFVFTNASNDITTFHCWNQGGNQSANYVLTQTDFLLKQQIRDFRNGTYGTMGQIGAFDFISLVVIIIVMIGLNRTNEAVAGFFCIVGMAALAFFEIIGWNTVIIAGAAVIIMLAISSTRKD